jgi:hypothetical protein
MKKLTLLCLAVFLAVSWVLAQEADDAAKEASQTVILKGTVIDNASADAHKNELAAFLTFYNKTRALKLQDADYSLFVDGMRYRFSKASTPAIELFLNKENSRLQVTVVAKKSGDELAVISLRNQE